LIEITDKSGKTLHLVHRLATSCEGRSDLISPDNFIQCSFLNLDKGKTFKAHKHIWKKSPREEVIAQESWVVIRGSVMASFYDTDGNFIQDVELRAGDASFTLEGGHNYTILEDDTLVYEYKTGPYEGQQKDKEFLKAD